MAAYEYVVEIRAGFNKLSADMRSVSGQFKKLENDITGTFKSIGTIAKSAAVIGGVFAVNQLKNALIDLAKRGEAVGSVKEGFDKLGGSSSAIREASRATIGLVSSFDLMKVANQAILKGIPDVNKNFGAMAEYAGRIANTLDMDTNVALQNLSNALASTKEKQLQAIGITINADEAYRKYAEAQNIALEAGKRWQDVLTDQQQKVAKQNEALVQMRENTERIAPVTDSVANAQQAYSVALSDAYNEVGIAVNENDDLRVAYRDLEDAIKKIDWSAVGKSVAAFAGVLANLAGAVLPAVIQGFNDLATGVDTLFGDSLQAQANRTATAIASVNKKLEEARNSGGLAAIINPALQAKVIQTYEQELAALNAQFEKQYAGLQQAAESGKKANEEHIATAITLQELRDKELKDGQEREQAARQLASAAKEAAAEAKRFSEALDSEEFKLFSDSVKDGLTDAVKGLDRSSFKTYVDTLKEVTKEGVIRGFGEGYKNASKDDKARGDNVAEAIAERAAAEAGKDFQDALIKANTEATIDAARKYDDVADKVRDGFSSAFRDAANGDWKDSLFDVAGSLAGALTAAFQTGITKNPTVIAGLADLGTVFGNYIARQFGAAAGPGGGGTSAISGLANVAIAAGQSYFTSSGQYVSGVQGPANQLPNGNLEFPDGTVTDVEGTVQAPDITGYIQSLGTVLGTFERERNKENYETEGSQVGSGIGAVAGSAFGPQGSAIGAMLGDVFGGFLGGLFNKGPTNAETKARIKFEQWLEDQFENLGNVRFFDANGQLGGYFDGNIRGKELTSDFSPTTNPDGSTAGPVWVDNMKKWGDTAFNSFTGLGEALKNILGITEEVGGQLGYILGTNLSGNIDNARLLVQQLGLSFEDVSQALLNSALKGQISWLAFNTYIRDTGEAFKPGLVAIGDISGAFDTLIASAGQGREAIKGFKDIAVEALEAGVTSMEGLRQYLLNKGYDSEYVGALIDSAAQRGLTSLEAWASASEATAGAVVGDMEAASQKLQEAWAGMRDTLKELSDGLKEIPKEVSSRVNIRIQTEFDQNTRDAVDTLGSSLPSGIPSEGVRDITTSASAQLNAPTINAQSYNASSASLGVGSMGMSSATSGVNINIDAKNAGAGVEYQIAQAARNIEANVISKVIPMMKGGAMRGGRGADY